MSATQTSIESPVLQHAKECADDLGINLDAYIEKQFHTTADHLKDWQQVQLALALHRFRKCKAFSNAQQHYHPCEDCKRMAECKETECNDLSYGICRCCLEGEPY